jgi:ABC-2 type transport system ATP-binding protein
MWQMVEDIRLRGKTVFLTTHFMEEAERLCDQVAILDHGRIVALDTPANLIASLKADNRIIFTAAGPFAVEIVQQVPGVMRVEHIGEQIIVYGQKEGLLSGIVAALETNEVYFTDLRTWRFRWE